MFVVAAAFAYTGYQKAMKAAKAAMDRQNGLVYQVRSSTVSRRVIYGIARVGGIEAYVTAGTSGGPNPGNGENNLIHFILIWGDGPCKSVRNIQLNGVDVPLVSDGGLGLVWRPAAGTAYEGHLRIEHRLGDHTTPTGVGVIHGWETTDKLHKICHSWVEMLYDKDVFPNGVVSVSAVIEGRNDIIDPRDDSVGWTDNVGLCFAHYMALPKLGPGVDYLTKIAQPELIACANGCDEDVGGEKRYTFNGVIQMEDEPEDNIHRFRTAMAGSSVYSGGKWRFYAGAYITPTFEITEDMVISTIKKRSKTPQQDKVNTIKGLYVAESFNWQPTDFPAVFQSAYIAEDGGREMVADIDLPDTITTVMARRIASIELERSRRTREISITCNIEALRAQAALPVLFHFPALGFNHQPMEVIEWGLTVQDRAISIPLTLRETDAAIFDPPATVEPEVFIPEVMPPIYYRRVISFRWGTYLPIHSPVFVLAAQPSTMASSFRIEFAFTEGGDYKPTVNGKQAGWALPVSLETAVAAGDSTVRVKLLPVSASGANPQRGAEILSTWTDDGDHDGLLLILLAKDGSNVITSQEILSVDGAPSFVGSDVYDIPVLRGRLYSTATAFGAGSFPDAFANYEGWIIQSSSLSPQSHRELLPNVFTGVRPSFWLRYTPIGAGKIYQATTAFAEFERRTAAVEDLAEFEFQTDATHQPTDPFAWPTLRGPITTYDDFFPPASGSIATYHRRQGGLATKIGFAPYTGSAPKRWLNETGSGTLNIHSGNGSSSVWQIRNDSSRSYDASTGAGPTEASGHGIHTEWTAWDCGGSAPAPVLMAGSGPASYIGTSLISVSEAAFVAGNSTFFGFGGCDAGLSTSWGYSDGGLSWVLSNEDTPENAATRLFAGLADIETLPWDLCLLFPCGYSLEERMTTGITAHIYNAQFRIVGTGFASGRTLRLTRTFRRTDADTLAQDTFQLAYSMTTDGSGAFELISAIPREYGFKIELADVVPEIVDMTPNPGTPDAEDE